MQIKVTYPIKKARSYVWNTICDVLTILFVVNLFVCPIINICVGGKAWSVIAVFSSFIFWHIFIYPSIYELNRTTQFIKFFVYVLVLLILIDWLIAGGWGVVSIPIVGFSGLIVATILFYSDFERQKHHSFSYFFLMLLCFVAGIVGLCLDVVEVKWMYIVNLSLSVGTFIVLLLTVRKTIFIDLKKKMHIK